MTDDYLLFSNRGPGLGSFFTLLRISSTRAGALVTWASA